MQLKIGKAVYEGEVINGKPHGLGTLRYDGGDQYVGAFIDGKRSGLGVMIFCSSRDKASHARYEGEWTADMMSGYGVHYLAAGAVYCGEFSTSTRTGYGVYLAVSGNIFVGPFSSNARHGFGQKRWLKKGSMHWTEYRADKCVQRIVTSSDGIREAEVNVNVALRAAALGVDAAIRSARFGAKTKVSLLNILQVSVPNIDVRNGHSLLGILKVYQKPVAGSRDDAAQQEVPPLLLDKHIPYVPYPYGMMLI